MLCWPNLPRINGRQLSLYHIAPDTIVFSVEFCTIWYSPCVNQFESSSSLSIAYCFLYCCFPFNCSPALAHHLSLSPVQPVHGAFSRFSDFSKLHRIPTIHIPLDSPSYAHFCSLNPYSYQSTGIRLNTQINVLSPQLAGNYWPSIVALSPCFYYHRIKHWMLYLPVSTLYPSEWILVVVFNS